MQQVIDISGRKLGEGHPVFITAECGATCIYDMDITKQLIDVVKKSGADAIKFMFTFPDEFMSDKSVEYTYGTVEGQKTENMYTMFEREHFSLSQWREIKAYAEEKGVLMFSSVDSPSGIDLMEELQLPAYKISSWDLNYFPFLRRIAKFGKPMIVDTGPVDTFELAKVMQVIEEEGNDKVILVHCFHTEQYSAMNMRALPYMRRVFGTPVGYSSADTRDETDIMAVTLGACFLEKRLTIRRDLPGYHHILSKTPDEFCAYVELMRSVQAAMGQENMKPSSEDLIEKKKWFRRLVAKKPLTKGTVLKESDLEGKRPPDGISPEHLSLFVGRTLTRDLKENDPMRWEDV